MILSAFVWSVFILHFALEINQSFDSLFSQVSGAVPEPTTEPAWEVDIVNSIEQFMGR